MARIDDLLPPAAIEKVQRSLTTHKHRPWKPTLMANGPTCIVCGWPLKTGDSVRPTAPENVDNGPVAAGPG